MLAAGNTAVARLLGGDDRDSGAAGLAVLAGSSAGNAAAVRLQRSADKTDAADPGPPTAAPPARLTPEAIAVMSPSDRMVVAFRRAPIAPAVRDRILAVLTPQALVAALVSFAAVFAVAQLTPVGWAADLALVLTAVFAGAGLIRAAQHLVAFAEARSATSEEHLDRAGEEFADAVAEIGVDTVLLLLTRKLGPAGPPGGAPPAAGPVVLMERGGALAVVAVNTVPAQIASQAGIAAGALMSTASGEGGGGGGSDKPTGDREPTAAEHDWEKAQAEADRQNAKDEPPPKDTEHGTLRQQERGALTPAELGRLQEAFPRLQPDGSIVRILSEGRGMHTVVVTNAQGQNVTVIRHKTPVELRGLSRNYGWNPPYE